MNFEHVSLGLLATPTKDLLENMGHIRHEVDRIIPDDDHELRLASRLGLGLHIDFGHR